jgi:tetratricopeptide (TPR) repeat protein
VKTASKDFSRTEISFGSNIPDEKVLTVLPKQMRIVVRELPQTVLLQAILSGLQRHRPHLLEQAVAALRSVLDEAEAGADHRLICWRYVIETLNHTGLITASGTIAAEVLQILEADPQAGGTIRAHLLNEVGNCLRYAGDFVTALQIYDAALDLYGRDIEDRNTRVVMRNRAIVLRSLHRFAEACDGFAILRPLAHDIDLVGLVSSEALCLTRMGESEQALALLAAHRGIIEAAFPGEPEARNVLLLHAQLLLNQERKTEARALVSSIIAVADQIHDPIFQASAASISLELITDDLPEHERSALSERAITAMQNAMANALALGGIPDILVGITAKLDDALVADGRADEAEPMLRGVLDQINPAHTTTAWLLTLNAFRHAWRRCDMDQAMRDLVRGVSLLGGSLSNVAAESDPIALLAPNAQAVTYLTSLILQCIEPASPVGATWLRIAADVRAAPLLTPRLRHAVGLPTPVADPTGESEHLGVLLAETLCIILQIVIMTDDVGVLVTRPGKGDIPHTELRQLGIGPGVVEQVGSRLAYALRRANPDTPVIDLDPVTGWPELRGRLHELVAGLPTTLPLCIIPGPLGSTIPTLAFGRVRALCFVPSIGALVAMRIRRRALPGGLHWRPRSLFDFAVWFENERAEESAALSATADRGAAIAAARRLAYDSAVGTNATSDNLLSGLAKADLAYIACHGRILPEANSIDLIVAAAGRLPPNDLAQLLTDRRAPHVLGWQRLAALSSAPTVSGRRVGLSCAAVAGTNHRHTGRCCGAA